VTVARDAKRLKFRTQPDRAALANTDQRVFQDRCLKPLGHPSKPLKLFSDLRGA
jgi:hypothetical protein